jgi:hypothetical protein
MTENLKNLCELIHDPEGSCPHSTTGPRITLHSSTPSHFRPVNRGSAAGGIASQLMVPLRESAVTFIVVLYTV